MRVGYQYVVLRLVPDVTRGEFINVAVVLHCQAFDFLDVQAHANPQRVQAFSPTTSLSDLDRSLAVVQQVCAGAQVPGLPQMSRPGQRFGWLAAPRSTTIQPGPVHGGTTDDPAAELSRLADCLLG